MTASDTGTSAWRLGFAASRGPGDRRRPVAGPRWALACDQSGAPCGLRGCPPDQRGCPWKLGV